MYTEWTITLDPDMPTLLQFLEYVSGQGLPVPMSFAAVVWPFSELQSRPVRILKLASELEDGNDRYGEVLAQAGYRYFDDPPLGRPADIVRLSFPGTVKTFLTERAANGFYLCSTMGAWFKTSEWRFAFGFSTAETRDKAIVLLTELQAAERDKALNVGMKTTVAGGISRRFSLSAREIYDVVDCYDQTQDTSISNTIMKFETADRNPWVYHAGITDWGDVRHGRLYTYVHNPRTSDRDEKTEFISQKIFESNGILYKPHHIIRMMVCRDKQAMDWESLATIYQAISVLAANGIYLDSIQSIVPPKLEADNLFTLYSVPSEQAGLLLQCPAQNF